MNIPLPSSFVKTNKHVLTIYIYRKYSSKTHYGKFDIDVKSNMTIRELNTYICNNIDYHPIGARFYKTNGEEYNNDYILAKFNNDEISITNNFCVIYNC